MHRLFVLICLILSGCAKLMPNKAIVDETRFCEANGFRAYTYQGWYGFMKIGPVRVECRPREK